MPPEKWERRNAEYARDYARLADARASLTTDLGLPEWAFASFPGIGCRNDYRGNRSCWTFPERDAQGRIIGLGLRMRNPNAEVRKLSDDGSARGLSIPAGWNERAGPLLLVEGRRTCSP